MLNIIGDHPEHLSVGITFISVLTWAQVALEGRAGRARGARRAAAGLRHQGATAAGAQAGPNHRQGEAARHDLLATLEYYHQLYLAFNKEKSSS